jgi:hypothetical protein
VRPISAEFALQRTPGAGWWWLCALLLTVSVVLSVMVLHLRQRTQTILQQVGAFEADARVAREAASRPVVPLAPPYDASAREMLAAHTVPWPTLLAALESLDVPGVRVMSLDYDALRATARTEFAFDRPETMLKTLADLNAGSSDPGSMLRWQLLEMNQRGGVEPGRAVVEARWGKFK